MQNIATTVASKALVAVVAAAMIFSAFVTPAKAATAEELQKMINDLMAQMAALGGTPATTGGSSASVCPFTWTRDLKTGATGADVMTLQKFLNSNADTRVAATGAGSAGMETQTFGPATAAAVSKFQVMHRADILTPAGLTNPTGFFGPSTRAKANALCVAGSTGGDEDEDDEDDTTSGDLSGEADLTSAEISSADEDEIEEGAEEAPVAEFTVEFEDGDASISRLDVSVSSTSDAWEVLDTVQIWVDGEMVAEEDASDEDNYLDEDTGTLRFTGLDIVAMEDDELDIVIAVNVQGNVDSADLGLYNVSVDAIRFFDADGVATTDESTGDLGDTVSFTLKEAGFEDEILVKTSSNDPDAATLRVEDDSKSDFLHVFSFDIDTDDSVNDIELDSAAVALTLSAAYNLVVDDAELEIDGVTIDDFTVSSTTVTNPTLTFDVDGDVTIDAGDRVEAKLMLRFKALATEGTTVVASVASAAIEGEGADDETSTGSATGDTHTLRTTGVSVDGFTPDVDVTTTDTADNSFGEFVLTFDVTAVGDDEVFIPLNAAAMDAGASTTRGAVYKVTDTLGNIIASSSADQLTASLVLEDGGDDSTAGYVRLEGDETATLKLTVVFNPGSASGQYIVSLDSVGFAPTAVAASQRTRLSPATDYDTAPTQIQS